MTVTPECVVGDLVRVVGGALPRRQADRIIDRDVRIHMDAAEHLALAIWYKWIHLLRVCGRLSDLQMTDIQISMEAENPCIVVLSMRWTGLDRSSGLRRTSDRAPGVRYRLHQGRIVEIWTSKANYPFVFGNWITYRLGYRAFLGWAILYFWRLRRRGGDYASDAD